MQHELCGEWYKTWEWGFKWCGSFSDFCTKAKNDTSIESNFQVAHAKRISKGELVNKAETDTPKEVKKAESFRLRVIDGYVMPPAPEVREKDPETKCTASDLPTSHTGNQRGILMRDGTSTRYELVREFKVTTADFLTVVGMNAPPNKTI